MMALASKHLQRECGYLIILATSLLFSADDDDNDNNEEIVHWARLIILGELCSRNVCCCYNSSETERGEV